ncbi:MAG TPA: glycerol-3-phosphate 1-O-acyltransferase PlsY [Alphaproteobacteria bacterium]|nr:glycerol-3-phosphate 1-O-acyltransferase PlsY [Alphaproteobacteria bacterium]
MLDPISWSLVWPYYLAALAGGYLLGSIPFGLVLTALAGAGDLRKIGSGNIGATNVLRTGRKGLAAATVLLDGGKGLAAVLIAAAWGPDLALLAGLGAVLGHLFPIWLRFKGGKGVATTLGVLLAIDWRIGVAACATWLVVAAVSRFSSLAALIAIAAAPLYAWYLPLLWAPGHVLGGDLQVAELAAVLAVLVWAKHHENIRRLLRGEEPRIGARKGAA